MELDLNREDVQMIIDALVVLSPDTVEAQDRRWELIDFFERYIRDDRNF